MNLFINNTFIKIFSKDKQEKVDTSWHILESPKESSFIMKAIQGNIYLKNASNEIIIKLIEFVRKSSSHQISKLYIQTDDAKNLKRQIKGLFNKIMQAAGGVIRYEHQILLMFRRGKWDLPKGKIDKGESTRQAAIREVKEECNIEASIQYKIGNTWHNFTQKGSNVLKKTTWYAMTCQDITHAQPQISEDIEYLDWMDEVSLEKALTNTYASINHVLTAFHKNKHTKNIN